MVAPDPAPDSPLDQAWETVDQSWDDPEAHRRLLALASGLGLLPELAGRYRAASEDPDRAEVARAQQGRIVGVAIAALANSQTDESNSPRRVVLVLRACAFCFLVVCVALFARAVFR